MYGRGSLSSASTAQSLVTRSSCSIHSQMGSSVSAGVPLPPAEGWSGGASAELGAPAGRELCNPGSRLV